MSGQVRLLVHACRASLHTSLLCLPCTEEPNAERVCARAENLFCGKRPNYKMVTCGYFRRDCIEGIGVAVYCPAQPPPEPDVYVVNGSERGPPDPQTQKNPASVRRPRTLKHCPAQPPPEPDVYVVNGSAHTLNPKPCPLDPQPKQNLTSPCHPRSLSTCHCE